jgi:solute carrier family 35 protein E4
MPYLLCLAGASKLEITLQYIIICHALNIIPFPLGRLLKEEKVNSLALLYHISLPSSCLLGMATIIWEGEDLMKERTNFTDFGFLLTILASCLNGIIYNILTFVVTFYTSPLTLKVLGNGGILLNIAVSVFLFNHSLSMTSIFGIMVTLVGIVLYQKSSVNSC